MREAHGLKVLTPTQENPIKSPNPLSNSPLFLNFPNFHFIGFLRQLSSRKGKVEQETTQSQVTRGRIEPLIEGIT